jgi:hypothetical protein
MHQLHCISNIYGYVDAEGLQFTIIMPTTGVHSLVTTFNLKVFAERLTEIAHQRQYIELRDVWGTIIASSDKRALSGFFQSKNLSHLLLLIERLGSSPGSLEKGLLGRYGDIYE